MSFSLLHPDRNKLSASIKKDVRCLLKDLKSKIDPTSQSDIVHDIRELYSRISRKEKVWGQRLVKVIQILERKMSDPSIKITKNDEAWIIAGLMYFHIEDDVIQDYEPFDKGFADDCYAIEYIIEKLTFKSEIEWSID